MKISEAFPSKYINALDIPNGKRYTAHVSHVSMEHMSITKEDKAVAYFTEFKKGLILNVTNARAFSTAYGDDTDMWIGKAVTLIGTKTEYQGEIKDCVRVEVTEEQKRESQQRSLQHAEAAAAQQQQQESTVQDEDIPF